MIKPMFCNYDRDHQQRLGFLKLVSQVGEDARGGPQEILNRLRLLYRRNVNNLKEGATKPSFSPQDLVRHPDIPSWQVGFTFETLEHLITWAKRIGIISATGRISEWGSILNVLALPDQRMPTARDMRNPFLISLKERAFFVQVLFYHDQVLPFLLNQIGNLEPWTRVGVSESCTLMTTSLVDFLENVKGNSPEDVQVRTVVRSVLERIEKKHQIETLGVSSKKKQMLTVESINRDGKRKRNFPAEHQAVCRFEQLTDIGMLTKERPGLQMQDDERAKLRTSWSWYVNPHLIRASSLIKQHLGSIESFLTNAWIKCCATAFDIDMQQLDAFRDQAEIGRHLDTTLPQARRQIGPIQVYTWASLACLDAFSANQIIEIGDVMKLLLAIHREPRLNQNLRVSGQMTLRDATVVVNNRISLETVLRATPVTKEYFHE